MQRLNSFRIYYNIKFKKKIIYNDDQLIGFQVKIKAIYSL